MGHTGAMLRDTGTAMCCLGACQDVGMLQGRVGHEQGGMLRDRWGIMCRRSMNRGVLT